jgi:putrescine transport system ATP-binding protein
VQCKEPECEFYIDHGFAIQEGTKVWTAIRPEKIRVSTTAPESVESNQMKGVIDDIGYLGKLSTYRIRVGNDTIIEITSPNQSRPRDGSLVHDWEDEIYLSWDASSVIVLTK